MTLSLDSRPGAKKLFATKSSSHEFNPASENVNIMENEVSRQQGARFLCI